MIAFEYKVMFKKKKNLFPSKVLQCSKKQTKKCTADYFRVQAIFLIDI